MVAGNYAFQGDTITDIVEQILDTTPLEPIHLCPEIPKELNHLIMQMLSKKPDQRIWRKFVFRTNPKSRWIINKTYSII